MPGLKGAVLGLVFFVVVNAAASLCVALLWRLVSRRPAPDPRTRSSALFALRLFPGAVASFSTLGLFLPAYALFEPAVSQERVAPLLLAIAGIAALLVLGGLRRGFLAWRETRDMERAWSALGRPVEIAGVPALCIEHPFPLVTVVGFFRPQLYVAEQVLANLDAAELEAVVAHELSHVRACDNLRRLSIDACFDLLAGLPTGRQLLGAWTAAAEEAADRRAVGNDARQALTLAEALLKVARLVPARHGSLLPALALHNGESLAARVARLLAPAPATAPAHRWVRPVGLGLLLCALACYWPALPLVHEAAERILAALS